MKSYQQSVFMQTITIKKTFPLIILIICISALTMQAQGLFGKTYRKGYFYNSKNEKIIGLVSFSPYATSFYYKENADAKWEKISIKDIKSVVSTERTIRYTNGNETLPIFQKYFDSLSVKSVNKEGKNLYLAKLILKNSNIKIYSKTTAPKSSGPSVSITQSAAGSTATSNHIAWKDGGITPSETIFMFEKGEITFELTKKNYKTILSQAFADDPNFLSKIEKSQFKDLANILYTQ